MFYKLLLVLIFLIGLRWDLVKSQGPNPYLPPYGCNNFGSCKKAGIAWTGIVPSTDYYYCTSSIYCLCNNGTSGDNCTQVDDMCACNPCTSGICQAGIGTYSCVCPANFTGDDCEMEIDSPCASSPCLNGGECSLNGTTYECQCSDPWVGDRCQYINTCLQNPCVNGGVCQGLDGLTKVDLGDAPTLDACKQAFSDAVSGGANYQYFTIMGSGCWLSKDKPSQKGSNKDQCNAKCKESASIGNQISGYDGDDQICGKQDMFGKYAHSYSYTSTSEPQQCPNLDCSPGVCIEYNNFANCSCPRERLPGPDGKDCSVVVDLCDPNPCGAGNNCTVNDDFTWTCNCANPLYFGPNCKFVHKCAQAKPICSYGSTCVETPGIGSGSTCECLTNYYGSSCQYPDQCVYEPCKHGVCSNVQRGLNSTYQCKCEKGWSGSICSVDINECLCNPCQNFGTCSQVKPPADPFYNCACIPGTTGTNCEINPNDCPKQPCHGNEQCSPCNVTDPNGLCVDGYNEWSCQCSPQYTGPQCDINIIIYNVMMDIFGQIDDDMLSLLNDLLSNPAMIKDIVPFILGLESMDNRTEMSYTFDEMFVWAAYEEKTLNGSRDFYGFNDVVLGNCFTFNHRLNENPYKKRMFGETQYSRLGGKYGVCVNTPSEVKSFYYAGGYTTDGCIRSCYQDAVMETCECMDPRFPMPEGAISCDLKSRNCVDGVSSRGDPSLWPSCKCPLPCFNEFYTTSTSQSPYVTNQAACWGLPDDEVGNCTRALQDTVIVEVTDTGLDFQLFAETPAASVAPGLGRALANLAAGNESPFDLSVFSLKRFDQLNQH
ncbi:unnamed protein product, partial [Mesorhabditis belari]|uniref:EGF-like domain-containing protein n=1 Tax=Mesorhabditis belari TaxID=2138241 RepID=A0AAF3EHX5_9BILA